MKSPKLKEFSNKFKSQSLTEIHQGFVTMDRFSAVVQKQEALLFPEGNDLNGAVFEQYRDPAFKVGYI